MSSLIGRDEDKELGPSEQNCSVPVSSSRFADSTLVGWHSFSFFGITQSLYLKLPVSHGSLFCFEWRRPQWSIPKRCPLKPSCWLSTLSYRMVSGSSLDCSPAESQRFLVSALSLRNGKDVTHHILLNKGVFDILQIPTSCRLSVYPFVCENEE